MDVTDSQETTFAPPKSSSETNDGTCINEVERPKQTSIPVVSKGHSGYFKKALTGHTSDSSKSSRYLPAACFSFQNLQVRSSGSGRTILADSTSKTVINGASDGPSKGSEADGGNKSPQYTPYIPFSHVDIREPMEKCSDNRKETFSSPSRAPHTQKLFPNLKKSDEMDQNIKEKLSTLLMYKELKTFNHYNVQYSEQNNSNLSKKTPIEAQKKPNSETDTSTAEPCSRSAFVKKEPLGTSEGKAGFAYEIVLADLKNFVIFSKFTQHNVSPVGTLH